MIHMIHMYHIYIASVIANVFFNERRFKMFHQLNLLHGAIPDFTGEKSKKIEKQKKRAILISVFIKTDWI